MLIPTGKARDFNLGLLDFASNVCLVEPGLVLLTPRSLPEKLVFHGAENPDVAFDYRFRHISINYY